MNEHIIECDTAPSCFDFTKGRGSRHFGASRLLKKLRVLPSFTFTLFGLLLLFFGLMWRSNWIRMDSLSCSPYSNRTLSMLAHLHVCVTLRSPPSDRQCRPTPKSNHQSCSIRDPDHFSVLLTAAHFFRPVRLAHRSSSSNDDVGSSQSRSHFIISHGTASAGQSSCVAFKLDHTHPPSVRPCLDYSSTWST